MIDTRECYVDVPIQGHLRGENQQLFVRMLERRVAKRLGRPTPLPFRITMEIKKSPTWGMMRCYPIPRYLPDYVEER